MALCPLDIGLTSLGSHLALSLLVPFRDEERKGQGRCEERLEE